MNDSSAESSSSSDDNDSAAAAHAAAIGHSPQPLLTKVALPSDGVDGSKENDEKSNTPKEGTLSPADVVDEEEKAEESNPASAKELVAAAEAKESPDESTTESSGKEAAVMYRISL